MNLHTATITLPLERIEVFIGLVPVTMVCKPFEVAVEYRFAPATVPEDRNVFAVQTVSLVQTLAMHDAQDVMSLVISAKTDILQYLGARQLDWIEENLPVPQVTA
jgi:hypothetical protein